jgi:hypothetical protein
LDGAGEGGGGGGGGDGGAGAGGGTGNGGGIRLAQPHSSDARQIRRTAAMTRDDASAFGARANLFSVDDIGMV